MTYRVDDPRVELVDQEAVDGVHVFALARAEAQVVQTRAVLVEGDIALVLRCPAHHDPGAAPDAVDDPLPLDERLHLEEVAELLPERNAGVRVPHGELDVGDAVRDLGIGKKLLT